MRLQVYSRLFGWLVDKINTSTAVKTLGHHRGR
jgi:myosin heavy subunit